MAEGNTDTSANKQGTQRIYYCFTLYPDDIEMLETVETRLTEISKKWIFGIESCPTTGRKHLQGFMALKKKMRITELKIPFNPHIEACQGTEAQNIRYCSKDKCIKSFGFPKPVTTIKQEDFNTLQKTIYGLFLAPVEKRKIYWFYDEVGCSGKSDMCKYLVVHHNILFCNNGKCADLVNLVFNQEEVTTMIWDLPRDHDKISYSAIESVKNGMVCNTKYETGVKVFDPPHIFIFSNFLPDIGTLSPDRWVIYKVADYGNDVSLMSLL